jgi:hypothetical protein
MTPIRNPLRSPLSSPLSRRRGGVAEPAAPVNTGAPTISGSPVVYQTLTANRGSWTGYPSITYTYQWRRDEEDIDGATNQTYELQEADYEADIDVVVTGTNTEGSDSGTATAVTIEGFAPVIDGVPEITGAAPIIDGPPGISGTAEVGETLTAVPATVTGFPVPTRSWQWLRDGSNIIGAINSTYTLVSADNETVVSVLQTETNAIGSDSAESDGVDVTMSASLRDQVLALFTKYSATGAMYDFSDNATLFQDTAGSTPVTASGQSVARANDLTPSARNLLQSTSEFRPERNATGIRSDGSDDRMIASVTSDRTLPQYMAQSLNYEYIAGFVTSQSATLYASTSEFLSFSQRSQLASGADINFSQCQVRSNSISPQTTNANTANNVYPGGVWNTIELLLTPGTRTIKQSLNGGTDIAASYTGDLSTNWTSLGFSAPGGFPPNFPANRRRFIWIQAELDSTDRALVRSWLSEGL